MKLLILALVFGIILLLVLLAVTFGKFKAQLRYGGWERAKAIIKVILIIETLIYIAVFLAVIVRTMAM